MRRMISLALFAMMAFLAAACGGEDLSSIESEAGAVTIQPTMAAPLYGTTLSEGQNMEAYRLRLMPVNGDVDVAQVSFRFTPVGVTLNYAELWATTNVPGEGVRVGDPVDINSTSQVTKSFRMVDTSTSSGYFTLRLDQPSRVFTVRLFVSGVNTGDSVATKMVGDSILRTGTMNDVLVSAQHNLVWSNRTAVPHSASSSDWRNGKGVVIPSSSRTLTAP